MFEVLFLSIYYILNVRCFVRWFGCAKEELLSVGVFMIQSIVNTKRKGDNTFRDPTKYVYLRYLIIAAKHSVIFHRNLDFSIVSGI